MTRWWVDEIQAACCVHTIDLIIMASIIIDYDIVHFLSFSLSWIGWTEKKKMENVWFPV